jgi:WD40 repeat protein
MVSPTYIKPSIPEQIENAAPPTYIRPALENASSPTYIRPALEGSTPSTSIKPPIPEQLVSSLLHPQSKIGRRGLIIGGAAAAVVLVGGGATLAVTSTRKGSPTKSSSPTVSPVHFTPGQAIASLTGHTDAVTNVVWSPDGRYLASASLDKFAMLWDLSTALRQPSSQTQTLKQPAREWNIYPFGIDSDALRWTPDGRSLLTLTSECPTLFDAFSSTSKPRVYSDRAIKKDLLLFRCPMISRQNATLAAIDRSLHRYHKIDLWHLNTFTTPYASLTYTDANQFIGDSSTMNMIAWSPDSTRIAGITTLNEVVVWNIKSHTPDTIIKLPDVVKDEENAQVFRITLTWSPTNPHLLAVANIGTIDIVDVQQKKVLQQLYTDDREALNSAKDSKNPSIIFPNVVGITWSPDGRYIAASYARSSKVFVWDLQAKNAKVVHGLTIQSALFPQNSSATGSTTTINDLSWSPDGHYLAAGFDDHSIMIWQVDAEKAATTAANRASQEFSPLVL